MPVAASVAGTALAVADLRVRYLMLDAGVWRIIDRSNHVVEDGRYALDATVTPPALDLVGARGASAGRTLRAIYALEGDALTVCYDLEGGGRPSGMQARDEQLLLRISYARVRL